MLPLPLLAYAYIDAHSRVGQFVGVMHSVSQLFRFQLRRLQVSGYS